jgi:hypothetical protein
MPDVRVTRVRHDVWHGQRRFGRHQRAPADAHLRSIDFFDADIHEHRSFESCVARLVDI